MLTTRRTFLKRGLGTTSLFATGITLPGFLSRTARAVAPDPDNPILVVIQMTGGNDGLNTVIPIRDDAYHRARPTLRVADNTALELADNLALHPAMAPFKRLYDDGLLGIINNVGYPNPDRSHFRSMDIWHTASLDPDAAETGWLGRVVDCECGAGGDAEVPLALHLDQTELPVALHSAQGTVPSIRDIGAFSLRDHVSDFESALSAARQSAHDDLLYVQRIAISSCRQARRLREVTLADDGATNYPAFGLAQRLRQIARLIAADFGPRIYYTSFGGFDTHARQQDAHALLLRELAESVAAFEDDLAGHNLADRVLTMTFSEFGRRVAENGSRGTDHGAGAPMFLIGPAARPGTTGGTPVLDDPAGDVPFQIDFRAVYAALLDHWLGVNHRTILGDHFGGTDILSVRR